jgi:hypothetical protein
MKISKEFKLMLLPYLIKAIYNMLSDKEEEKKKTNKKISEKDKKMAAKYIANNIMSS